MIIKDFAICDLIEAKRHKHDVGITIVFDEECTIDEAKHYIAQALNEYSEKEKRKAKEFQF
jgi:acetylornithine deacetylase/succinyl-diaminopimelate desuccinylase-like protein